MDLLLLEVETMPTLLSDHAHPGPLGRLSSGQPRAHEPVRAHALLGGLDPERPDALRAGPAP